MSARCAKGVPENRESAKTETSRRVIGYGIDNARTPGDQLKLQSCSNRGFDAKHRLWRANLTQIN
jgi:hypothetical protein